MRILVRRRKQNRKLLGKIESKKGRERERAVGERGGGGGFEP